MADNCYIVDAGQSRIATYDANGNFTGNNGYVDDDSAYLIPNAPNNARRMFGPSTLMQFFGTVQPIYMSQRPDPNGEGIILKGDTFQLPYFARPDLNVLVAGKNLPTNLPTTDLFGPETPRGVGQTPTKPAR